MRRVVIASMSVLLVLCIGIVTIGYFAGAPLLNKAMEAFAGNVTQVMTDALYQTSFEAIAESPDENGSIQIRDADLSVNNAVVAGEAGWESGTSGTVVYGIDLSIGPDGIKLGIDDRVMYSGVPVVMDGRLELTKVQTHDNQVFGMVLSEEEFERMIETGMNEAFASHHLVPTDVSLRDGRVIVSVLPAGEAASTPGR